MTEQEQRAMFTVCLMAAFADGQESPSERDRIDRLTRSLDAPNLDLPGLHAQILRRDIVLEDAVTPLASLELQAAAYEMARAVCEADGAVDDAEQAFLARLQQALRLPADLAVRAAAQTQALTAAPIDAIPPLVAQPPTPLASAQTGPPGMPLAQAPGAAPGALPDAALDGMILNYAILNGALELLPETVATLAIIPIQMNMVYRIGKHHGFDLDRGHIKDFVATAGLGFTSQVVESYARKLVQGLAGRFLGRMGRAVADQATSSGLAFATTYAMGHLARQYYAGGRRLDASQLKASFASLIAQARGLQSGYAGDIAQRMRQIDPGQLLTWVRNQ
jgi:uncharacterized protein (DUF697 family)